MRSAWVYIMGSERGVLYIGVTGDLDRRVFEHRNGIKSGFATKYQCYRLLYSEQYQYLTTAIAREATLKSWTRAKKLELIRSTNPDFHDLAGGWGETHSAPNRSWPKNIAEILRYAQNDDF